MMTMMITMVFIIKFYTIEIMIMIVITAQNS